MAFTSENKPEKQITMGILAHVDAGKTTLSEGILYTCKAIRKLGRVDHQDAFLDTNTLEKNRGITIFSKQAECTLGEFGITLLDTPGHVDFSAEMERTLQVLDYGILVISGADGVQGHTETLWRLLSRYQIPVFLFINKMDQPGTDRETLVGELKEKLDTNCVDFSADQTSEDWKEQVAVCDEQMMEAYLEGEEISRVQIQKMIRERKLFPCYFGSALKLTGVKEFLEDLGLSESGLDKLISASYNLLGLISYLTTGPDESRAWTIERGTKAPQAAGKIHTDFERGFIRAEVVSYDNLVEQGSMNAAKEKGLVRSEGKDYVVQDGDVVLFRFNV